MTQSVIGQDFTDLKESQGSLWVCSVFGLVYSILIIYFLANFAETIAWAMVVMFEVIMIGGCCICFWVWHSTLVLTKNMDFGTNNHVNKYAMESYAKEKMFEGVLLGIGALVYLFVMFFKYKHIKTAINVIDAACEFIIANPRIVVIPFVYFTLTIMMFLGWLWCMAAIISLNDVISIQNGVPFSPQDKQINWNVPTTVMCVVMVLGLVWIV